MLPLMMPHDLMMPIMPDMAMAPMPMLLPYALNICSGVMSPTAVVMDGSHVFSTVSLKSHAMPGTSSHHTAMEPMQIINV